MTEGKIFIDTMERYLNARFASNTPTKVDAVFLTVFDMLRRNKWKPILISDRALTGISLVSRESVVQTREFLNRTGVIDSVQIGRYRGAKMQYSIHGTLKG